MSILLRLVKAITKGAVSLIVLLGLATNVAAGTVYAYNETDVWLWFDDQETHSLSFSVTACPVLYQSICTVQGFNCVPGLWGPDLFFVSLDPVEFVQYVETDSGQVVFYFRNTGLTPADDGLQLRFSVYAMGDGCGGSSRPWVNFVGLIDTADAGPFTGTVAGATERWQQFYEYGVYKRYGWSWWSFGLLNIGRQMSPGNWVGVGGPREPNLYTADFWQTPADVLIAELLIDTFNNHKQLIVDTADGGKLIILPGAAFGLIAAEAGVDIHEAVAGGLVFEYAQIGQGAIINGTQTLRSSWEFNWAEDIGGYNTPSKYKPRSDYRELAIALNHVVADLTTPSSSCVGFEPPMASGPVTARGNRVLPLKSQLFDADGHQMTDLEITAPPVIQVAYQSAAGGEPQDVTGDALPAGFGTDGNEFEYNLDDQVWQYNLKTKDYTAAGTYTITMVSGDESEYVIEPTCAAVFIREE